MTMILNMTQHAASDDQMRAGVFDPTPDIKAALHTLLTFDACPSQSSIKKRARQLADIAYGYGASAAMIGGAPYLMGALQDALQARGIKPCYAFSKRASVDVPQPDGSVRKVAVFKHAGFVWLGI